MKTEKKKKINIDNKNDITLLTYHFYSVVLSYVGRTADDKLHNYLVQKPVSLY